MLLCFLVTYFGFPDPFPTEDEQCPERGGRAGDYKPNHRWCRRCCHTFSWARAPVVASNACFDSCGNGDLEHGMWNWTIHCRNLAQSQKMICKLKTMEGPCECLDSSFFLVFTLIHILVYQPTLKGDMLKALCLRAWEREGCSPASSCTMLPRSSWPGRCT